MSNQYQYYSQQANQNNRRFVGPPGGQLVGSNTPGGFPDNGMPRPQNGTYNPDNIPVQQFNERHNAIYAHQHFGQNNNPQHLGQPTSNFQYDNPADFDQTFFPQDNQLSVQQEPKMKYTTQERFLLVNSKDRNLTSFPQPEEYVVHLSPGAGASNQSAAVGEVYKNVICVELIGGTIPDQNSVRDQPFLLLHIDELDGTFEATNSSAKGAYTIIQLDGPVATCKFINIRDNMTKNSRRCYDPPIAQLSKLTIKITDQSGVPFSFGDDTMTAPPNVPYQHSFLFRITERVLATEKLESRSLFY